MLQSHDFGAICPGAPKEGAALLTNLSTALVIFKKRFCGKQLSRFVKNRSKERC
jgi:hypothetical protein